MIKTNIKVIEKIGKKPGKTAVVLVGMHGNETCGIDALTKILLSLSVESGKVFFIYGNLEAIKQNKRFIEHNLNRCFLPIQPKEIASTLEGKTALELMSYLDKADVLLDIHSSNSPTSIPFIISDERSITLAKNIPFEIVSLGWDKHEKGSSDFYMHLQNKRGICVECGYTKDQKSVDRAILAIRHFLISEKIILGNLEPSQSQTYYKIISLYKNNIFPFKKEREFADFEILQKDELIGKEGNTPIYVKKGKALLFVRDRDKLDEECFLVAEKISAP